MLSPAERSSPPISHYSWCLVDGLLSIQTRGRKESVISYLDNLLKYFIFNSKIKCFIPYLKCLEHFTLLKYFGTLWKSTITPLLPGDPPIL